MRVCAAKRPPLGENCRISALREERRQKLRHDSLQVKFKSCRARIRWRCCSVHVTVSYRLACDAVWNVLRLMFLGCVDFCGTRCHRVRTPHDSHVPIDSIPVALKPAGTERNQDGR